MRPRRSVPRIRVDFLDASPSRLSPSTTLDMRDILSQIKLSPNLLTEDLAYDDAGDTLYLEDAYLQDIPPFPVGRRPPFFTLHPHRTRLPFHIRPEAFEMGDFFWDEEDVCPVLTIPTRPRMKMMIMEQMYVRKWIVNLTSDHPPKHIPWTCERSAAVQEWIAEGSIFPSTVARPSVGQLGVIQDHSLVTERFRGLADPMPRSAGLHPSVPGHVLTHAPSSHVPIKSADVHSGVSRGQSKTSRTQRRIVRASQARAPSALLGPDPPVAMTPNTPLAARRGRLLSGLKLKGSVIEQLEYPDIPTAFRGSPSVWSPQFDAFPVPPFTNHQSMLLNLQSKRAALESGMTTYVHEPLCPQTEITHTSLSVDEWAFALGLVTFGDDRLDLNDNHCPKEVIVDTSIFLPYDSSTPAKQPGFTVHPEPPPLDPTPSLQSPAKHSYDPPGVPLPPRPALVSPSTPPHVRGILKKVKSVRFEDMIDKEPQKRTSFVTPLPASPEDSSFPLAISPERPCALTPTVVEPASDPVKPEKTSVLGKSVQDKKPPPKSRLPPKRTGANGKHEPAYSHAVKAANSYRSTSITTPVERPCRIARAKENAYPLPEQKGVSVPETDVRRGLEGPTKSRLSAPLRNIFRFR